MEISRGLVHGTKAEEDFLEASKKLGWPEVDDMQNLDAVNGAQRVLRYISPDGKRQDAAHGYLHPKLQDGKHPNLHVVVESQVVRILFENQKASGVVYRPNPVFRPDDGQNRTIKAKKMVVLTCGAIGTPLVLERSGIGEPNIVARAGVPLTADVPGVGNEYEDHQLAAYPYKTNLSPEDTFDGVLAGRVTLEELLKSGSRWVGYNAQDVTCKVRPSEDEVTALGPEFEEAWNAHFKNQTDKPLAIFALINA